MTFPELTARDEGRHPSGPEELWGESWYLDWAAPDASYGGYVRLGLYPNLGLSWWWIALVGAARPLVLVVDHALPCPEGEAALTPAAGDTSVALTITEPFQRFHVVSEAVGTELADPAQAFHGLEGASVPVQLDLEWASRSEAFPYAMTTRYEISSWITGTVTVGDETITVDCAGRATTRGVCATGGSSRGTGLPATSTTVRSCTPPGRSSPVWISSRPATR